MLSLTQPVLVPTGVVLAGVELMSDDVDGDDAQAANIMALRAMVNHNRRDLEPYTVGSFAAQRISMRHKEINECRQR